MFPFPPHCATNRPPGAITSNNRANSAGWSGIQWKVALEKTASTGSGSVSSTRS